MNQNPQTEPTARLENDHNLYILGAGFSKDAGLPLVSDFLRRMRDTHPWLLQEGRKVEAKAVESVLEFRLRAASAAYWVTLDLENIEELFSLASISDEALSKDIRLAIAATIDYSAQTHPTLEKEVYVENLPFGEKVPWLRGDPATDKTFKIFPYTYYVARLLGLFGPPTDERKNTFITFNYDTILENALGSLRVPFSYGINPGEWDADPSVADSDHTQSHSVDVLKLHGSVDWARPSDRLTRYKKHQNIRETNLVPELIPPTWKKVFPSPLNQVWERAVYQLKRATRVIIIGFSMPPIDMHFKYLMAAGLQQNVSLRQILFVNPKAKEIEGRAKKVLREAYVKPADAPELEIWPIQFEPLDLHRFTIGTDWVDKIGRPAISGANIRF
jgi:hypothetical protein